MKTFHLILILLDGSILFLQTNNTNPEEPLRIVFDYSHGQNIQTEAWNETDPLLEGNLTEMGYDVIWARGGLNESVLSDATGLVIGSIYGNRGFYSYEIEAISSWFNQGGKFLWVGCDNDYLGRAINDNMTRILEAVGSHVYPEPCEVEDLICCCEPGYGYRLYAPVVSNDSTVADIVEGVERVLMHGPTLLYGSNALSPGVGINPVSLESVTIQNVYPLLYFSPDAVIYNANNYSLFVHELSQKGSFPACTLEMAAGASSRSILIVSGASPYADYQPMWCERYYSMDLNGYVFVRQAIEFGMQGAVEYQSAIPTEWFIVVGIGIFGVVTCLISWKVLRDPE